MDGAVIPRKKLLTLADIDILAIGNTIQISAVVFSGDHKDFILPLPGEEDPPLEDRVFVPMQLSPDDWAVLLNQSDKQDIRGPNKSILRKSQRLIDSNVAWRVFRRDLYACRYCGRSDVPLSVDHIDLWESGGATIAVNLISACRRCNKLRGSTPYGEWLASSDYQQVSKNLTSEEKETNEAVSSTLDYLETLRVKVRSR